MKKAMTGLAAIAVLVFAVSNTAPAVREPDFSNTLLTGQVLQVENGIAVLGLGELAVLQTPESAASEIRAHESVPASESEQQEDAAVQTFVSWQQDAVLDFSQARFYSVASSGQLQAASLEDVAPEDIVCVAVDSGNLADIVTILSGEGSERAEPDALQGTAANTINVNYTERGAEYGSASDDENALRVALADVTLRNVRVEKAGGSSTSTYGSLHYGLNATLLATGGAQLTLTDGSISSSAVGGSGVFSHGAGTMVYIDGGAVTTTGDASGGIQTAGGGSLYAKDATVITAGNSATVVCAASGGTGVRIEGGTYASGGYHSPVLYAAGLIDAKNAEFSANNSQIAVIEGAGSVSLRNCILEGNINALSTDSTQSDTHAIVLLSLGELPENVQTVFSMSGGSLLSHSDDLFYVFGTDCLIELNDVNVTNDANAVLLRVEMDTGADARPACATLNAVRQDLSGDVLVGAGCNLQLELTDGSTLTGAVQRAQDDSADSDGCITVHVDRGCTWSLTQNSTVDVLQNDGTILYNGYSITLADGTILNG